MAALRVDIHQHLWTPPLQAALAQRTTVPLIERNGAYSTVHCAGELPWQLDTTTETAEQRTELLDRDGLDAAIIAISSPIGIEALPRDEAAPLIEAHLDGVAALGPRFAAWAPLVTDRPRPSDVDELVERHHPAGISIAAGAIAHPDRLAALRPVLHRIEEHDQTLFVHPGRAHGNPVAAPGRHEPHWWCALTEYVAQMQAAWLAWVTQGRREHPELTVVFAMLAGLAPLHYERLSTRNGPPIPLDDPHTLYDTSSYGTEAVAAITGVVGPDQLLHGSDRPVLEPLKVPGDHGRQSRAGTRFGHAFPQLAVRPRPRHVA